jgi:hypothetical protein
LTAGSADDVSGTGQECEMGFREQQRAKAKRRVLEISRRLISQGKYPRAVDVAARSRCAPTTAGKYQEELIREGILDIPDGLVRPPAGAKRTAGRTGASTSPHPTANGAMTSAKERRIRVLMDIYEKQPPDSLEEAG